MRIAVLSCILSAVLLLVAQPAMADMGRILVSPAQVSESAQKAIILHNGMEEVLILGTDLRADTDTGILRFIPFPSAPEVSLAPEGVFTAASELLDSYGISFLSMTRNGTTEVHPVELLLHEQLGAHDMTVIKVNDPDHFRTWASEYCSSRNLPGEMQFEAVEAMVQDYIERGFAFFALDYVELDDQTRFVDPVLYRFESAQLYYPLKTSNSFGGQGAIDLLLFLPGTLCEPSYGPFDTCLGFTSHMDNAQASTSAQVTPDELQRIYPEAGELFGGGPVFLQMFSYYGDYSFDRDILEDVSGAVPMAIGAPAPDDNLIIRPEELLPEADPRCGQSPDPGPCKGLFERFFFDQDKGECQPFFYGGCEGVVPFETLDECESACVAR